MTFSSLLLASSALVSLVLLTACGGRTLELDSSPGSLAPVSTASASPSPSASASPPPAKDSPAPALVWSGAFTRGARPTGDGCAFGVQCLSGVCSADTSAGECGRCVEVQGLGQSCEGALQGCYPSAQCQAGVCTSLRKTPGEACSLGPKGSDDDECDFELYCDGEPGASQGVCQPRVAHGAVCKGSHGDAPCLPGDLCEQGVCVARLPGAIGDSCLSRSCQTGLECVVGDGYRCGVGALPPGATCGIVDGSIVDEECAPGTVCGSLDWPNGGGGPDTQTTCVALPLEGAPCIYGRCADGLFCHDLTDHTPDEPANRCERPRAAGEACTSVFYDAVECATGLECRQDVCVPACP